MATVVSRCIQIPKSEKRGQIRKKALGSFEPSMQTCGSDIQTVQSTVFIRTIWKILASYLLSLAWKVVPSPAGV